MNQRNVMAIGAVALLMLVGAGCSSRSTSDTSATQNPSGSNSVTNDQEIIQPGMADENTDTNIEVNVEGTTNASNGEIKVDANAEVKADTSAAVKEFTVTGDNFAFAPAALTVKKGDKVKITFKNVEGFHDLKIDEFNVATKKIQGGGEEVVEFVADKAGSFEYYCSVGSHRAMGMKGTLTVTE